MSAEIVEAVFEDQRPVPPGVQAILFVIAWKTPKGKDRSSPLTYDGIAAMTRQSRRTVSRHVLEAISLGALEVVWARFGDPRGIVYRVNRGEFYVPQTAEELSTTLAKLAQVGHQSTLDNLSGDVGQSDLPRQDNLSGDVGQIDPPSKRKEEKEKGAEIFAAHNPELVQRLREKGVIA